MRSESNECLGCVAAHSGLVTHNDKHDEQCEATNEVREPEEQMPPRPAGLTVIGRAEHNGDLFLLLEDGEGQYIFTQRLDDAEQWAVFSECMVGSPTAGLVYAAAEHELAVNPVASRTVEDGPLTQEQAEQKARTLFNEWQTDSGLGQWLNPNFGGWKLLVTRIANEIRGNPAPRDDSVVARRITEKLDRYLDGEAIAFATCKDGQTYQDFIASIIETAMRGEE